MVKIKYDNYGQSSSFLFPLYTSILFLSHDSQPAGDFRISPARERKNVRVSQLSQIFLTFTRLLPGDAEKKTTPQRRKGAAGEIASTARVCISRLRNHTPITVLQSRFAEGKAFYSPRARALSLSLACDYTARRCRSSFALPPCFSYIDFRAPHS